MEYPDLKTMYMLGSMGEKLLKDLEIDTQKTFSESLEANPDLPAVERVSTAMQAVKEEFLTKAPVWMRINMLSHMIDNAKDKGVPESDIDWDKINNYLTQNTLPTDFNNFKPAHTYEEFFDLVGASIMAQSDLTYWRVETCKDCGEQYYLRRKEIGYYVDKGLSLPKRCQSCRDRRKGKLMVKDEVAESKKFTAVVTEDTNAPSDTHEPTAMEIAMREAGIIE